MPDTLPPGPPGPHDAAFHAGNERGKGSSGRRLGRLPTKAGPQALHAARFLTPQLWPAATDFWVSRAPFEPRSFGNLLYGCCTRAKQANAHRRFERLEQRRTIDITDSEVIRVYTEMCNRLYGGGDSGAYETDALDCWRRPEYTFKDAKGRALTIDAYLRVNAFDHDEVKRSLYAAAGHGLAICVNLPWAFQNILPPRDWAIPEGQALIGDWQAGSWGGHSMWAVDYDEVGLWLEHTWELPLQRMTWAACSAYMDEAHVVIDSWDYWRTKKPEAVKGLYLSNVRKAVNEISSLKIA